MKTKSTFFLLLISVLLLSCNSICRKPGTGALPHSDTITISGAYALAPMVKVWISEFQKTHPAVKFILKPNGTGGGL